nr:MAG TPA: hypothetical protein [Caudoviricetes sp.]
MELRYTGRIAIIGSSQFAGVGAVYVVASNYNQVGNVAEVVKSVNFKISLVHKSNDVDELTVTTYNESYSWFVLYL